MENFAQNLLAAQIRSLQSQYCNTTQETDNPQLRIIQMNCVIQKFYQDQLQLLQQLQQYQQTVAGNVAPPSPPGSSIADEQESAAEVPTKQPPTSAATEENQRHEAVKPQENFLQLSAQRETSPEHAAITPGARRPVKAAQGSGTTKLRFHPYQFRQLQHSANALSLAGPVEVDLKYHKNMARSYGNNNNDCTPEQQERRMRNTQAARISRAKARAICGLLGKESTEASEANLEHKVLVAQKRVYIAGLLKLLGLPEKDLTAEWEQQKRIDDVQHSEGNESAVGNGFAVVRCEALMED